MGGWGAYTEAHDFRLVWLDWHKIVGDDGLDDFRVSIA